MRPLAVVGNLSRDLVDGSPPRAGGAPFHAARALRVLGRPALVGAKCADSDRDSLLTPLVRLGLPVLWRGGSSTAAFSFRYEGDRRVMVVEALGDPWGPADLYGLERADWVHVGALARSDFPAETLAELGRDRRVSFDGQGLVRPERTGPLELDAAYDPEVLRHVSILKLAEEEARTLVGEPDESALRSLGVPEVVVTLGSRGLARARRREAGEGSRAGSGRGRSHRCRRRVLGRLPCFALEWARPGGRRAESDRARGRPAGAPDPVRALVQTVDGVFEVDLAEEEVLGSVEGEIRPERLEIPLPLFVAGAATGSTVVAVIDRRPPLVVSNDAGRTWRESGGGLPPGRAVAVADDDPDLMLYAARNRLYLSEDGGRFWRALVVELPEIRPSPSREIQVTVCYRSLNSPRATITAEPPTSTRSSCSAEPSARA